MIDISLWLGKLFSTELVYHLFEILQILNYKVQIKMFDRTVKVINVRAKLLQSCLTLCDPMDYLYSMGFSWQECWNGLPCPPPGDLPNPGVEPVSLTSPALSTGFFTTSSTWESPCKYIYSLILTVVLWSGYHYSHSRDGETEKQSSYRISQGHTDISPRARLALSSGLSIPCYPLPQNSETQM